MTKIETPLEVVMRQIRAYADRNLDAFLDTYSDDAEVWLLSSNKLLLKGRDSLRDGYGKMFEASPNLKCEITGHLVLGEYVTLLEKVSGQVNNPPFTCKAIYQVSAAKILRLWLAKLS